MKKENPYDFSLQQKRGNNRELGRRTQLRQRAVKRLIRHKDFNEREFDRLFEAGLI